MAVADAGAIARGAAGLSRASDGGAGPTAGLLIFLI
jgi:hypothetical protein